MPWVFSAKTLLSQRAIPIYLPAPSYVKMMAGTIDIHIMSRKRRSSNLQLPEKQSELYVARNGFLRVIRKNIQSALYVKKSMTASRATLQISKSLAFRPLAVLALVCSILLNLVLAIPAESASQPRKILTGWIPYYSMKTSLPATLNNVDLINEVMPFWYTLRYNKNNKIAVVADLYASANPSVPISTPLTALRAAGILIIPTITDGMAKLELSNLLSTAADRKKTAKVIADFVITNNYDGIDLDFEGFAFVDGSATWAKTAPFWVAFIKELSAILRSNNKILSVSSSLNFNKINFIQGSRRCCYYFRNIKHERLFLL